jgi:succinoglycan biosynthesis transport protein ExoP
MAVESQSDSDVRMDMGAMLLAVWRRWPRILLVTVLLCAVTYGLLLFVPKMYESTTDILVEARDNTFTRATGETAPTAPVADNSTMSSQIELIKSRDTLLQVINSENLRSVPEFAGQGGSPVSFLLGLIGKKPVPKTGDDVILANLDERLTVIQQRDSAIISVLVRTTDPQLSARLANAIADAHVKRRADQSLSDTAEASTWLEDQIVKMRASVAIADGKVANFKVNNDLFTGTNSTSLVDQQLSDIANQITAAQGRETAAQSRADLILGLLKAGQPIDGVPDVRDSVTIQQLSSQKAQLQSTKAQLLATLLPNHPSVKAVVAQIAELDRQIATEGRRVASALEAEAKIEATNEASLRTDLTNAKTKSSNATKQGVTLDELDREAKAQRDLLETYLLRYREAASRADSNSALPDVRVVTLAAPSVVPVSPKTTLLVGAVGFVSLALQIGSILFGELLSGRAIIERRIVRPRENAPEAEIVPVTGLRPSYAADHETTFSAEPTGTQAQPVAPDVPVSPPLPKLNWHHPERSMSDRLFDEDAEAFANLEEPSAGQVLEEPELLVAEAATATGQKSPDQSASHQELANLSADMALGRVRIVMLAGLDAHRDCLAVARSLADDAVHMGLSMVTVDAGSGYPSTEPGITDLSAERASFGDIVHKGPHEGLAEVPWGHLEALDRRSGKPATLVEALSDIYEVVVVMTGNIGMASALPIFAGVQCRLVLVASGTTADNSVAMARANTMALGYAPPQIVVAPQHAEVA